MNMKAHLQRLLCKAADRHGYYLIPKWSLDEAIRPLETRSLLRRYGITCVIDVGANEGQTYDVLRRDVGFTGPIVSVEPLPDLAEKLRDRALASGDKNWRIVQCALGDADGDSVFNRTADTLFSSLLKPSKWGTDLFPQKNQIVEAIPVKLRRLDDLIQEMLSEIDVSRTFLKLDTQGNDLSVLAGLETQKDKIAVVQTEASVQPLYENMPDMEDTRRFLNASGFDLATMIPVVRDRWGRLIEFDMFAVNRKYCGKFSM